MEINDRVKVAEKFNARSTDPITEVQHTPDIFRLIKRGTLGTVLQVIAPTKSYPHEQVIIKLDGVRTSQQIRIDMLKKV